MQVGAPIELQFGEHWDLMTATGSSWFSGTISRIASSCDYALITLDQAVGYAGESTVRLLAMPRYEGQSLTPTTESIICGLIAADDLLIARFSQLQPRNLASWFQAIGTLKMRAT
jgi:hypothetical protein